MDLSQLEAAVVASQDPSDLGRQRQAVEYVNSLFASPDCWRAGLLLCVNSNIAIARYFGLTLLRNVLSHNENLDAATIACIRSEVWALLYKFLSSGEPLPQHIINNMVSVLILCAKVEYPQQWPSAFNDIVGLTSLGWDAIGVAVKMIHEFNTECVDVNFNDIRRRTEIEQNTRIKDAMRESGILADIITFLCQVAPQARAVKKDQIAENCLYALSQLVSWIDINLFIERGLPTVYEALKDVVIRGAAFNCLCELVKKGMDEFQKVSLLATIKLIETLGECPIEIADDDETGLNELGPLLNVLLLELLGCWDVIETHMMKTVQNLPSSNGEVMNYAPIVSGYLKMLLQNLVLPVFSHPDVDVFSTMIPSLNKLISILKYQISGAKLITAIIPSFPEYFMANEFVNPLLMVIYKVIQYPEDFQFQADDEDDIEVMEAVDEVRKLFVNICKVTPFLALEAIKASLQCQPQPLSQAPFPGLEASLRMVYSFGEGSANLEETELPSIVRAIHSTDVANHRHPMVLLQYYELSVRYFKFIEEDKIPTVIGYLLGPSGALSSHAQLSNRCSYLFLKAIENMNGNSSTLLTLVPSICDIILQNNRATLNAGSEIHLLEGISSILFSEYQWTDGMKGEQMQLLQGLSNILVTQIEDLIQNPILASEDLAMAEDVINLIGHKLSSITSIAQKFSSHIRPDASPIFLYCGQSIIKVCRTTGHLSKVIRERASLYFHTMAKTGHLDSLENIREFIGVILPQIVESDEMADLFKLVDHCMAKFKSNAFSLVEFHCQNLFTRYTQVLAMTLQEHNILDGSFNEVPSLDSTTLSTNEPRRAELQRAPLLFLQHAATHHCFGVFNQSTGDLGNALSQIQLGITGGRYLIGYDMKLPLRRVAVEVLLGLCDLTQDFLRHLSGEEEINSTFPKIDIAFLQGIIGWIIQEAVGLIFQVCLDGTSVNVRDAKSQSLLTEFGALMFSLNSIDSKSPCDKMVALFQTQGWPQEAASILFGLLQPGAATSKNDFQSKFKSFMRGL